MHIRQTIALLTASMLVLLKRGQGEDGNKKIPRGSLLSMGICRNCGHYINECHMS
jgi:hypothetical protein